MKTIKNPIKMNFSEQTIVISRKFAVKASIPGSKEYLQLTGVQESYPEYKIVIREIAKNSRKETYPNLTYAYMEYYISTHPFAKERMAEYKEKRLCSECHSMRYGYVKKWFLAAYPDINDFTPAEYKEMIDMEKPVEDRFEGIEMVNSLPLAS
jgi:hypothetical protein